VFWFAEISANLYVYGQLWLILTIITNIAAVLRI